MAKTSSVAAPGVPGVETKHLECISFLRTVPSEFRLNNGPFKIVHIALATAFFYFVFTHVPTLPVDGLLPTAFNATLNATAGPAHIVQQPSAVLPDKGSLLDGSVDLVDDAAGEPVPAQQASLGTDALDSTFEEAASDGVEGEDAEEVEEDVPKMWEPETPQDYVKVVWALVTVLHALVNLFCIWLVRVKVFCQFRRVTSLDASNAVLVTPHQYHGKTEVVPLVRRTLLNADKQEVRSAAPRAAAGGLRPGCALPSEK